MKADRTERSWRFTRVLAPAVIWVCAVVAVTVVGASYGRALTFPGRASVAVRTVDWVRDHGGGPLVDRAENWWYSHHRGTSTAAPPVGVVVTDSPAALKPLGAAKGSRDGEGVWEALPTGRGIGHPGYATYLRPDPAHPEVLAGVARFDQRLVRVELIAGTREPAPDPAPGKGQVPEAIRDRLVATFNSGYKLIDAAGGYYADKHPLRPLRDGAASAVIDDTGRLSVGEWGRDVGLGPHTVAVRQNLGLIVDGGRPVPGLEANRGNRWGSSGNQSQYTWRSGIGADAEGDLYYVAGDQLTLATLARALGATGALRAMELDIHPNMVHLFTYRHDDGAAGPIPSKLLDSMRGPADRYLVPDRRDFFAVTRR
ncbi:MAG TPA: hypothetical protein VL595_25815 [Pseudonocardia sp.]|nr:hypothetical protein [Pseudonocardia sp.]